MTSHILEDRELQTKGVKMTEQLVAIPAIKAASANGAIFGGAGFAIAGVAVGADTIAAIGGVVVGVLGLCMNWYWKRKQYLLLKEKLAQIPVTDLAGMLDG